MLKFPGKKENEMKRIIFEKLTIKEKKKVLAGECMPGGSPKCFPESLSNGVQCLPEPINPDSECAQREG
jgi:hypothetical protein